MVIVSCRYFGFQKGLAFPLPSVHPPSRFLEHLSKTCAPLCYVICKVFSDFATFRLIKRRHKFKKCSCICSWCDFCKINDECSLWQHWIQTSKQKQKPSRQPRQSCPHFQPIFCKIWNANFLKKFTYFQGFLLTFNVMTDIFWWFRTHISTISNCC